MRTLEDIELVCNKCNKKFIYTVEEQVDNLNKGYKDIKKCPVCRKEAREYMDLVRAIQNVLRYEKIDIKDLKEIVQILPDLKVIIEQYKKGE